MACIKQKEGKVRNTRFKHCRVFSSTIPLNLGLILSENTSVTMSFRGHCHGVVNRRIFPCFPLKNNSQQLFSPALQAQGENTVFHDLHAHRRCWVLCKGCCVFMQKGSTCHHILTLGRQQEPGNAAGMACAPVLPVKEGYSLAADWFTSEPSVALNTSTFLFLFEPISLVNKHWIFDQYSVKVLQMWSFWLAFSISLNKISAKGWLCSICQRGTQILIWMLGCHFIGRLIIFVSKLAEDINKKLPILVQMQGSMLANSSHDFLNGSLIVIICHWKREISFRSIIPKSNTWRAVTETGNQMQVLGSHF